MYSGQAHSYLLVQSTSSIVSLGTAAS